MGYKEEVVSIWFGYFDSRESFNEFLKVNYDLLDESDDLDEIDSIFEKYFAIGEYDRDIVEKNYQNNKTSRYELINGASYLENYIQSISKDMTEYNCAILLYDYEYKGTTKKYTDKKNFVDFFDKVNYKKQVDVSKWLVD